MNGGTPGPMRDSPDQRGYFPEPLPEASYREWTGTSQASGEPRDYRIWGIAATAVGLLFSVIAGAPAGLAAVYYSRRVRRNWETGDRRGAVEASRAALKWVIVSACLDAAGLIAVSVMISRGGQPAGWMLSGREAPAFTAEHR